MVLRVLKGWKAELAFIIIIIITFISGNKAHMTEKNTQ